MIFISRVSGLGLLHCGLGLEKISALASLSLASALASCRAGLIEGRLKMRDWNYRHQTRGVKNAGLEILAPCNRGGKCGTAIIGTKLRGGKCGTKQLRKAKTFYTFWYKIGKSLLMQL